MRTLWYGDAKSPALVRGSPDKNADLHRHQIFYTRNIVWPLSDRDEERLALELDVVLIRFYLIKEVVTKRLHTL